MAIPIVAAVARLPLRGAGFLSASTRAPMDTDREPQPQPGTHAAVERGARGRHNEKAPRKARLRIRTEGSHPGFRDGDVCWSHDSRSVEIAAANQPNKPLSNAKPEVRGGAFLPSCDLRHTHLS